MVPQQGVPYGSTGDGVPGVVKFKESHIPHIYTNKCTVPQPGVPYGSTGDGVIHIREFRPPNVMKTSGTLGYEKADKSDNF
jgi:hypothetical protein